MMADEQKQIYFKGEDEPDIKSPLIDFKFSAENLCQLLQM